jgi:hypothetical protein
MPDIETSQLNAPQPDELISSAAKLRQAMQPPVSLAPAPDR